MAILHVFTLQFLMFLTVVALLMGLPIKLAADFSGALRSSYAWCALGSLLSPIFAVLAFRAIGGGFNGFVLSCLTILAIYVFLLKVPARSILGFATLALGLQLATVFALMSLGFNIGKVFAH